MRRQMSIMSFIPVNLVSLCPSIARHTVTFKSEHVSCISWRASVELDTVHKYRCEWRHAGVYASPFCSVIIYSCLHFRYFVVLHLRISTDSETGENLALMSWQLEVAKWRTGACGNAQVRTIVGIKLSTNIRVITGWLQRELAEDFTFMPPVFLLVCACR